MKDCRDWSCGVCGSGWLEEVGSHKEAEGKSTLYCPDCKKRTDFEWRIREISDPEEELEYQSSVCPYCMRLTPNVEMTYACDNFSHPICSHCKEKVNEN